MLEIDVSGAALKAEGIIAYVLILFCWTQFMIDFLGFWENYPF